MSKGGKEQLNHSNWYIRSNEHSVAGFALSSVWGLVVPSEYYSATDQSPWFSKTLLVTANECCRQPTLTFTKPFYKSIKLLVINISLKTHTSVSNQMLRQRSEWHEHLENYRETNRTRAVNIQD